MDIRRLTDTISVAPQIEPEDLRAIADLGFVAVIDNRPDDEVGPGHSSERMGQLAADAGLRFVYVPVHPGQFSTALIDAFAAALAEAEGPVLAYCRSGTRSATVWALSEAGRLPAQDIIATAAAAGYDLSNIRLYLA